MVDAECLECLQSLAGRSEARNLGPNVALSLSASHTASTEVGCLVSGPKQFTK